MDRKALWGDPQGYAAGTLETFSDSLSTMLGE
jgi:hypothetical protein